MDDNSTTKDTSAPLSENQYVMELYAVLQENGRDSSGLSALLSHVSEMESFVKNAEDKISVMKDQLAEMKEIQNHPLKTTLSKAIKNLEHTVEVMKAQISKLKASIIEGCKSAVEAFREKGATALNNLASFFKVKSVMTALDKAANSGVKTCDDAVTKIGEFSKTYHQAGLAVRNMGRIARGKPTQTAAKEVGKLSKALAAPYKVKRALLVKISAAAKSTTLKLENLDARQAIKQAERTREKKPSLLENLAAKKELVAAKKLEMSAPEYTKTANLEV